MSMRQKVFSIFVLLLMAATGAWAQTETLLTTINSIGNFEFLSGSKTFNGIATVTFSGEVYNSNDYFGWYASTDVTLTVTAAEGYTITRVKFYCSTGWDVSNSAYDEEAPFEAVLAFDTKVNGISIGSYGVNKIEVYGYETPATVTLTESDGSLSPLSPYAGKTVNVTYTRSFTADKPSTVCLPFAYAPKTGETFYTFGGITKDGDDFVATMTEYTGATLAANTPYLYKAASTGDTDFSGIYTLPESITAGTTIVGDWTFVGTYETIEWTTAPTGIYGFSAQDTGDGITQGQFVKVGEYVRIKPMRCYLKYKSGTENYAAAARMMAPTRGAAADALPETIAVRLIGANGEVTSIATLNTRTGEVSTDGWYTLDGKRLAGQPTQKGIYVNNGKKVIIK